MFGKGGKLGNVSKCQLLRYFLLLSLISVLVYQAINNPNIFSDVNNSINGLFNGNSAKEEDGANDVIPDFQDSDTTLEYIKMSQPKIQRHLVVRTKLGRLRGFIQNVAGVEVQTFLSIPYAKPPTGPLRFRRTQPLTEKWPDIMDATRIPPPCMQSAYTQSLFPVHILNKNITEDCLFLNIWSPINGSRNKTVMVFIHGGLFTIGGIGVDEYDGRMLAAYGNTIVITMQYRLGIFGFLDLDSEQIPGNMGLFDQYTAIKWIKENIGHFGGNPDSITLFGTSAGSISIGFHMFNPMAKTLFKRAIIQSGSPTMMKSLYENGEKLAEKFTKLIGCYEKNENFSSIFDNTEPIIDCIDQTPLERILDAQSEMVKNNPKPFLPTIPSEYIEMFVQDYNESTRIVQKEILMGFNENEGALMLHLSFPKNYTRHTVPQHTRLKQVLQSVIYMGGENGLKESQATTVANLFIQGDDVDTPIRWAQKVASMFGDMMFVCPTYQFLDKLLSFEPSDQSENGDGDGQTHQKPSLYLYKLKQRPKNSVWGEWMQVTHHDEMNFVMGHPLRYPKLYNYGDIEMSKIIMKTWSHFAKTGKIPQNLYPTPWKPVNENEKYFMNLQYNNLTLDKDFHSSTCDLYSLMVEYI